MDFAFSTVLMFLIIVPGVIARYFYFTHPFSNEARTSNFLAELFWSVIPGLLIQSIAGISIPPLFGYQIHLDDLGYFLVGKEDNTRFDGIIERLSQNVWPIIVYQLSIFVASAIIGYRLKSFVRKFKLDIRFEFFRFSNKWYYIMSGEILDMDAGPDASKDIDFTGVDVLCKIGNDVVIYKGQLIRYYLSKNGDLDSILIRFPIRRQFNIATEQKQPDIEIPSNMLFIPNKEIININIRYIKIQANRELDAALAKVLADLAKKMRQKKEELSGDDGER